MAAGAERCDLCGASVSDALEDTIEEAAPPPPEAPGPPGAGGAFCNACGWQSPPGARFCSRCGARLQEGVALRPPVAGAPAGAPPEAEMKRRLGMIVGLSVLLVLALFLATMARKGKAPAAPAETAAAPSRSAVSNPDEVRAEHQDLPLAADVQARVTALEGEMNALQGAARAAKQRELLDVYLAVGRLDRAAFEGERIAQAESTALAWSRAGDLYYEWMESIDGAHKVSVAAMAVAAYQKALAADPDNHDARANMAWAYQYDPQNAMEAINQTNKVLEAAPEHLRANFNKGVFLIQINRLEQAAEQFERVRGLAPKGSPEAERAEAALGAIADMQAQRGSGAGAPGASGL